MASTEESSGRTPGTFSSSLQTAPSNPAQPGGGMPQTANDSPGKTPGQDNAPIKKKRIKKNHTGENALKKFFPDNFLKLHNTQGVIFDVKKNYHTRLHTHTHIFLSIFYKKRGTHYNTSKKNLCPRHSRAQALGPTRSK